EPVTPDHPAPVAPFDPKPNINRTIPTGSLALDRALGTGGWPRGRIVELFGAESSGKTTLALEAVAQAQRVGTAALIDADHATDPEAARRLGVDPRGLLHHRTNQLEDIAKLVEQLVKRNVDLIALDSAGALLAGDYARDPSYFPEGKDPRHQRMFEHWLKTLLAALSASRSVLLITNQQREKIGVLYGDPKMTPWETHPLMDFASVRVEVKRVTHVKRGEDVVGSETRLRVVKNRLAAPFKNVELDILFDRGIDLEKELVTFGLENDVLTQSGRFIRFGDVVLGRTREEATSKLRGDDSLADEVHAALVASFTPAPLADPPEAGSPDAGS
ncbi:MAG: DNA recombination/repair protein RecA, partial [Gemmataceae bacterium]|nr:DNA recombination/repair protein RecA [Gemmataceae bacterium]